jgi:putative flippase GtrA
MTGLRFLLVGACSEVLYLALYAALLKTGAGTLAAISMAGAICLLLNGFLHARISFRVRYRWSLQRDYLLIQAFCLALALAAAWLMQRLGSPEMLIGLATLVLWAATSFTLTRWRYRQAP